MARVRIAAFPKDEGRAAVLLTIVCFLRDYGIYQCPMAGFPVIIRSQADSIHHHG